MCVAALHRRVQPCRTTAAASHAAYQTTSIFSKRCQVPVLFTKISSRKQPVWQEGELCISGGAAELIASADRRPVDSGTVSQSFLDALEQGEEQQLQGHRVMRTAPSPPVTAVPAAAREVLDMPQQSEAASRQFITPRQAKRPRRPLLAPPTPGPEGTVHRPAALEEPHHGSDARLGLVSSPMLPVHAAPVRNQEKPRSSPSASSSACDPQVGLWSSCALEEEYAVNAPSRDDTTSQGLWTSCALEEERVQQLQTMFERTQGSRSA
mmetsp:Transcript_51605/g.95511  ORF Transcript_51605/g.95511 Transcript_51605/m.95511 type:complete len:266 (-) Transcript_51605:134-931(-)